MRARWIIIPTVLAVAGLTGWAGYRIWPRKLDFKPVVLVPVCEHVGNQDVVTLPSRFLIAEISRYDDEFFAYLMYGYFRGLPELAGSEVLLTYAKADARISYHVQVHLPNDLLSSLPLLWSARGRGLIEEASWRYVTGDALDRLRYQTHVFLSAYNLPPRERLEEFARPKLVAYIRRFVRFQVSD